MRMGKNSTREKRFRPSSPHRSERLKRRHRPRVLPDDDNNNYYDTQNSRRDIKKYRREKRTRYYYSWCYIVAYSVCGETKQKKEKENKNHNAYTHNNIFRGVLDKVVATTIAVTRTPVRRR